MRVLQSGWMDSDKFTKQNPAKTKYIVIHHDTNAPMNNVIPVRKYHTSLGWLTTGYHFWISHHGQIFQERPISAIGVHTGGHNTNTIGICLNGNFENTKPTEAQIKALVWLLSDLYKTVGEIPVKAHRDFSATACCGENLYKTLPEIIERSYTMDEPSTFAVPHIQALQNMGITNGERPKDEATREEVMTLINRLYQYMKEEG